MFSSTTNSSSGTVTTVYPFPYNFPLCSSPYNNHPPHPQENRTCGGILGLHHDQSSILNDAFMVPGPEGTIINLGGVPSNAVVSSSGDYHGQQQQCGYGNNVYRPHIVSKEVKVPEVAVKKDRHSKIFTAQGLRDRRVRLSINVAREFFDLQDLLGFDKASKTLEWLLSKSSKAIKDLEKSKCNNTNSLSSSSTSECDVVSDMNTEESEGNKKMKEAAAIDHAIRARESRAKARARARERTREKMCSTSRRSPQIFSQLSLFNELETADMNQEPGGTLLSNYQAEHHESVTVKKKLTAPSNSNYHDRILGLISKSTETGSNSCSHVNIQFPNAISQNWDINGGAFPCLSILCHYHQHES